MEDSRSSLLISVIVTGKVNRNKSKFAKKKSWMKLSIVIEYLFQNSVKTEHWIIFALLRAFLIFVIVVKSLVLWILFSLVNINWWDEIDMNLRRWSCHHRYQKAKEINASYDSLLSSPHFKKIIWTKQVHDKNSHLKYRKHRKGSLYHSLTDLLNEG